MRIQIKKNARIISSILMNVVAFTINRFSVHSKTYDQKLIATWYILDSEATIAGLKFYSFKFDGQTYWVAEDDVEKSQNTSELIYSI